MINNNNSLRRIVLTGGPGVGKSTVINLLADKGYDVVPEAARLVIEREQLKDSDCLPWKNLQKFQDTVSSLQLSLEDSLNEGVIFSDRGLIDGYAYAKIDQIKAPELIIKCGRERYDQVFLLDILPNYQNDSSRREDAEKAKFIHQEIKSAYLQFDYSPISVPVLSPQERTDFILNKIKGDL